MLSQTAEYALRAAVFLSEEEGTPRNAHEISISTHVPQSYVQKVLTALTRAHVVKSRRGPHGGFMLARPARDISAFDVINAVAPWIRLDVCPLSKPEHTNRLCPLHQCIADTQAILEKSFRGSSLRELVDEAPPPDSHTDFRGHEVSDS